jgi:hypothetical protein
VATCKLNDVNPVAYIAETLTAILDGHPHSAIEDLMPWRFRKASSPTPSGIGEALTLYGLHCSVWRGQQAHSPTQTWEQFRGDAAWSE